MIYLGKRYLLLGASAAVLASVSFPAIAQSSQAPQDPAPSATPSDTDEPEVTGADAAGNEIVVTGTLLRGVAPTGTNVVSLSRQEIIATGAMSANEILANIPQVTTAFLSTPTVSANDGGIPAFRPNIRDLGRASGSTTLVLVDGHRLAGVTGDSDAIPPGVLERVEVVPDGGSSTYGSDAIGGVINFITRKSVDGFEAIVRQGFGDEYASTDVNLTAGKIWDSGSAYVSYAYQQNDEITGRDRDYMQQIAPNQGYCSPGTIVANGTTYALPGRVPGTMTSCDVTDDVSFWPAVRRNTVFAAFSQDITDFLSFDVRGQYVRRDTTSFYDFRSASPQTLTITNTNPYFQSIAGETSQTVLTSFAGVFDNRTRIKINEFQITPTLTARLGGDWQLRVMGNYGTNVVDQRGSAFDAAAIAAGLAGTTTATALNPYDLGASNAGVLASISRTGILSSRSENYNIRAIADGVLLSLPGGEVNLAVGAEYQRDKASDNKNGTAIRGQEDDLPPALPDYARNIKSVFGELAVPIVGADNAMGGIQSLTLSASARYDDYSDVGGTFNPKFGFTYVPVDWVKIRGNWGTSFNAPTPDQRSSIQVAGALPVQFIPGQQAPWTIIVAGFSPDVKPQTADTWSVGFDLTPPVVPGLRVSATYYNVFLKDQIGLLGFGQVAFSPELADFVKDNQTCATYLPQYPTQSIQFLVPLAVACSLNPQPTFGFLDLRQQNLGQLKQDGIDFDVAYNRPVGFGSVNARFAGTYLLSRESAIVAGAPFTNELEGAGTSRMSFVGTLGAQAGNVTGSVSWNHRQGYDLNPSVTSARFGTQNEVDSFNTVDLFLAYNLPSEWLPGETALTLNVTNLFDQDPPFYNGCIGTALCGFINGSTLGRLVTLGLRTKF